MRQLNLKELLKPLTLQVMIQQGSHSSKALIKIKGDNQLHPMINKRAGEREVKD